MTSQPDDTPLPHARQVEVNGHHVWVLEDAAGVVEVADSPETLRRDHHEIDPEIRAERS